MRIYYVVNARMPNKKAYGIQIAKMCEAFIEAGVDLTLVVPSTRNSREALKTFFGLRVDVPVVRIPTPDLYGSGRYGFLFSSLWFSFGSLLYLLWQRMRGPSVVYAVDMDTFSFVFLPIVGGICAIEMHDAKPDTFAMRFFFRRVARVIVTNAEIRESLRRKFDVPSEVFLVEPNGVDIRQFDTLSKAEARKRLRLPEGEKMALYAGRLYDWKGLAILAESARNAPGVSWYVIGGDEKSFEVATGLKEIPENLTIAGEYPLQDMPVWYAAADVLLVLGTKENERSYRHTSPMKLFEYMAARRPVVASSTPALRSIIHHEALWYVPDDAGDLAEKVICAMSVSSAILERAHEKAATHSWAQRAVRIRDSLRQL